MSQTLLLTGGTGYIGSHVAVALQQVGYQVILLDNLSNSSLEVLGRIEKITGIRPWFYQGDIRDRNFLMGIFAKESIDVVIHLAWKKAVGESCKAPFLYYENNILGSMVLFEVMEKYNCRSILFSSTATVYYKNEVPFVESSLLKTNNPYSTSKLVIEQILEDLVHHAKWKVIDLRYFNPIGAHDSGIIWEEFGCSSNNLLPNIVKVIVWKQKEILVHGNDYDTPDWTCVRDYIHVMDLALAHVRSIPYLLSAPDSFVDVFNIGTGRGVSVLEMIEQVKKVFKTEIPYSIVSRRKGDMDVICCRVDKAKKILSWSAVRSIEDGIRDMRNFLLKNNFLSPWFTDETFSRKIHTDIH